MTAPSNAFPSAPTAQLDARGLVCPMPVLKAQRQLRDLPPGTVLELLTTDPMSWKDVPDFCNEAGHTLLLREESGGYRFLIRKA